MLGLILFCSSIAIAQQNITIEKKFSQYKNGDKLKLSMKGGAPISIRGEKDRDTILVRLDSPPEYWVNFQVEKRVLSIEGSYTDTPMPFGKTILMSIQLPKNFDLELDSDGGTIQLADLKGNFKGISLGGDIHIAGLEGKIDFQTNGGNISVNGGNLEGTVRTLGGNIQISEVEGKLHGISDGGRLVYRNVYKKKYDGEVQLSTLGGDIEIDEAPYGASVNTNGGNIIINMANDNVRAVTKGGNVILRNIRGNIDAQTHSGNIEAKLLPIHDEEKSQHCNLESKSGDVVL